MEPSLFDKFSDEKGMKIRCMFETFASGGEGERTLMTWSMKLGVDWGRMRAVLQTQIS